MIDRRFEIVRQSIEEEGIIGALKQTAKLVPINESIYFIIFYFIL
jgi:hypothetical protein